MLMQPCPKCGWDDTVNETGRLSDTCRCDECGAVFEIDADADWDGEGYTDCSTVGQFIEYADTANNDER